ncbi:hypothetical protein I5U29_00380 [Stenotrophomonas maltophilia]|nr:Rap1a/Tai family immunity protein [Stenotrophomonas pavanii]MBC9078183.1 hypothetical protein [Stenotrophomonas maltophilia]MBC9090871.1 hypothetical protein [Stenotrophomonas maltophilia]MBH1387222.1 hypothetical protein [Stenotrophomonas maltophilia]MBH1519228.1 hypothetical protein [Stenotrophomonas maltophilia]MBN5149476.1 hypothetical protein [Stenotrophomonas maltophilia]
MWALGLACLWAGSASAAAAPQARTWFVTGSELVSLLQGNAADGFCAGEQCRSQSSARASAYIQGVADASRGHWCGQGQILPHELVDRVATHLRQLPQRRLHEDASVLVVEALEQAFPCGPAAK